MALEASLANIIVRDNTIDQGRFSDGVTPVTYNYTHNAWIFGTALIDGNTFTGPAASADMLNLDNCSCIVKSNKFIRGSTNINSYIRNYGTNEQHIVDNIFDSASTNGTIETLVLGLTDTSIYERNKNQTKYVAILPSAGEYKSHLQKPDWTSALNFSSEIFVHPDSDPFTYNVGTNIRSNSVSTLRYVEYFLNLSNYLPKNVKVLDHLIGMRFVQLGANIDTAATSAITVRMSNTLASLPISGSFSSPSTTLALVAGTGLTPTSNLENTATTSVNITSGNYNITTVHYNTANYAANNFMNKDSTNIIVAIKYAFTTVITQGSTNIVWSPLLIKYRWS